MTSTVSSHPIELSIERPAIYVVATPIGNLQDLTVRAAAVLGAVDRVLVEDTRTSVRLFNSLGMNPPMTALHDHNEAATADKIVQQIKRDQQSVALISDAGTPLISDPGFRLIAAAHAHDVVVRAVPGPCAAIAALSVAGIASDRFVFEGFLPPKKNARQARISSLTKERRTIILYEAPHRVAALLQDIAEGFSPDRQICVARELTKLHETLYRGAVKDVISEMHDDKFAERGELVVVVDGAAESDLDTDYTQARALLTVLDQYLPRADAVRAVADITGLKRNALYRLTLAKPEI